LRTVAIETTCPRPFTQLGLSPGGGSFLFTDGIMNTFRKGEKEREIDGARYA
jgi:hypothetical protein